MIVSPHWEKLHRGGEGPALLTVQGGGSRGHGAGQAGTCMLPGASSVPPAETTHDMLQVANMELKLCPAAGQPSGRGAQAAPCLMQSSSNANRPHPHQCGQSCCLLCHLREINTSDRGASARKQGSQEHLLGSSKIIPAYWKKTGALCRLPLPAYDAGEEKAQMGVRGAWMWPSL